MNEAPTAPVTAAPRRTRAGSPRITSNGKKSDLVKQAEAQLADARKLDKLIKSYEAMTPWGRAQFLKATELLPTQPGLPLVETAK